jgi:hypothetical protein
MAKASRFVVISNRFDAFDRSIEQGIRKGLENAAGVGARQSRSTNTKGYRIDAIVSSADVGRPQQGRKGLEISIVWKDFRAIFFEKGTYQSRRGKLKRERTSTSTNRGVKAVRFMVAARKAGAERLLEEIHDAIGFR